MGDADFRCAFIAVCSAALWRQPLILDGRIGVTFANFVVALKWGQALEDVQVILGAHLVEDCCGSGSE